MRKHIIPFIIGFVSLLAPWFSYGSDAIIQQSPLYPFRSSIFLQDEFLSGLNTNGTIGSLGFGASGGTTTLLAGETNRYGIVRRDTSAVINTIANMTLNSASSSAVNFAVPGSMVWLSRLNTNDANTTVRIGAVNLISANPPANGIYFEKLDADTNWFCVTRSGGVQTRTDSGVAIDTNFNNFTMTRNSSGALFSLNNTTVCTHTTNITATFLNPAVVITNSAAAAKTIDIDYFQIILTGISR